MSLPTRPELQTTVVGCCDGMVGVGDGVGGRVGVCVVSGAVIQGYDNKI